MNSPSRWGIDRGLAFLIGGVAVLILAGLIAVPLLSNRTPPLAPPTSPEGVVQRFYTAAYAGDWATAHAFLSADTAAKVSIAQLQDSMRYSIQNSQVRVASVAEPELGSNVAVNVTQTTYTDGGLFGGSEYSSDIQVLLARDGDSWKIVSGPFAIPQS